MVLLTVDFFIVEKRDRATLLPIIQREVEIGSTIHSDEWRAYSNLSDHGYVHKTVNHQLHFIDTETANTQSIESTRRRVKVKYCIKHVVPLTYWKGSWWKSCGVHSMHQRIFLRHEKNFFNGIMHRYPRRHPQSTLRGEKLLTIYNANTQLW